MSQSDLFTPQGCLSSKFVIESIMTHPVTQVPNLGHLNLKSCIWLVIRICPFDFWDTSQICPLPLCPPSTATSRLCNSFLTGPLFTLFSYSILLSEFSSWKHNQMKLLSLKPPLAPPGLTGECLSVPYKVHHKLTQTYSIFVSFFATVSCFKMSYSTLNMLCSFLPLCTHCSLYWGCSPWPNPLSFGTIPICFWSSNSSVSFAEIFAAPSVLSQSILLIPITKH